MVPMRGNDKQILTEAKRRENARARAIGIGILAGIVLAALGATDGLRNIWFAFVGASGVISVSPVELFSAYLFQTFILVAITFRAYGSGHHGIAAATWILATWEAIAAVVRRDLLFIKRGYPELYTVAVFLHVVASTSFFLAAGRRAYRVRAQAARDARYRRQAR